MLVLDRIKDNKHLSDSEVKIAQYILENPKKVIEMTIFELSDATYASASTITRFCRKVEVDGFSDLKLQIAKELNTYALSDTRIKGNLPFTKIDSHQNIASNIMNLNIQSMLDTYNNVDIEQLVRISKDIQDAYDINLYGSGQSLILCEDLQYKLFRIGIDSNLVIQKGFQRLKSGSQRKDSLTIMISYYGQGSHNLEVLKALKERGTKNILITGPKINPLVEYADEVVHVPPQEELMEKMASYSSRAAMQLVIDIIYALVFSFNYEENQAKLQ
ncbi:MAG: MurR/RpiR family transcriptional regulator [Erysipelothrix sp.]|nr:MurR/RpiR family transcriptional regulator [Erysipelothrix sp.]